MRIVVAAVPGSGKTTIMKMVKARKPSVKIVNIGDIIAEIATKRLRLKDRDKLRKLLTLDQQRKFQEEAAKKVSKMRGRNIIIDTHTSVKTPDGFFPGLSEKSADLVRPDVIVFLDYEPKDIIKRRKEDKTRSRDADNAHALEEHQKSSIEFAYEAAAHVEAAVDIIELRFPERRPFDHAKKAADEIIKLLENKR